MRKLLLLSAVAGGVCAAGGAARAEGEHNWQIRIPDIHQKLGPKTTSVTWPSVDPPGWYSNTYRHRWYYPWYAYYDFTAGPYANWMAGGGYAGYANHGPAGYFHYPIGGPPAPVIQPAHTGGVAPAPAHPAPVLVEGGIVSIALPADAKLLFNGVAATGSGAVRTFKTPPLEAGRSYQYQLTAEVTRDGRVERATGTVTVRAGETASVTLAPNPIATASK
jgi:uncharacterized protein (TIGR03000 family)